MCSRLLPANKNKIGALVFLFALIAGPSVWAQERVPAGEAISETEIDRRIHFIEEHLDSRKKQAQIWTWSWLAINAGSFVGLGTAAGLSDKHSDRVNYGSQAVLAAIGVGDLLLRPLAAQYGAEPIRKLPAGTRDEKLAKLHAAEQLLHSNADRVAQRKQWLPHIANFVLNAAAGIATANAGDSAGGMINAGVGFVLGEVYILGVPSGPQKDWEQYEAMISRRSSEKVHLWLSFSSSGLMLKGSW